MRKIGILLGDYHDGCVYNYRHTTFMLSDFPKKLCNFVIIKRTNIDTKLRQLVWLEKHLLSTKPSVCWQIRNQKLPLTKLVSQNEYEKINT